MQHMVDGSLRHVEALCQHFGRYRSPSVISPNGCNSRFRKFVAWMKLSRLHVEPTPTLTQHVEGIVFGGAQEQVPRVAASRHIAVMKHFKALVERAFAKLVSHAVCAHSFVVELELAIAVRVLMTKPKPAIVSAADFDLVPKPCWHRGSSASPSCTTALSALLLCRHGPVWIG